MSEIYTIIIVILAILAVSGLFVGVTNDAVNFLNSAIGSRAASMRMILLVASVGILVGVVTSSGMMEVARNGMFNPGLFTFHEVMMLYLGVMFANIILLDLYNSWGLPTSTTVSLVFCLLGAAIAVTVYKITGSADAGHEMGEYINTSRALGIVSAILLSVVIAFTCGTAVMYVSRLIFSFRYTRVFSRFGAFWCGASLTAIVYFALFKGLRNILEGHDFIRLVDSHLPLALTICWAVCSLLLLAVQKLKINILRVTILAGTFALALAFAGNDLVNFIGVPVAGFDAYHIAREAGTTDLLMEGLNENVPANFLVLLGAGLIMILTLWTSKKAMHVTETEISLSSQRDEAEQQYGSSFISRTIVRAALGINAGIERVVPRRVREAIGRRFEYEDVEHSGAPYDMIRATVNLTTSALLISIATSLKLPLSTTYVCFMVAMGSSLADRAWGRESAVYRISGVMTVVAGWFITALGGFLIAFVVGLVLIYGGTVAFAVVTLLSGWMLVRSNLRRKPSAKGEQAHKPQTADDIIRSLTEEVGRTMESATRIYDRTLIAVFKENRKVLREMVKESNDLFYQSRERKYTLLPTLRKLQSGDVDTAHYYVQVVDYLNEMTKALMHITRPAFEHIDNNHEGLSREQTEDLMHINDEVESIYRHINLMLRTGDFTDIDMVLELRDRLFESIAEAIKSELTRINAGRSGTKASMLYLTILNETKSMVLQSRNLLKSQRYFLDHKGQTTDWLSLTK
ncbi:inorganic phosphate transporter [Alistipes sp.]|jgi:phosphate/sulphate permeases|uniref:inorganic phosphate transporter n=1 Tax=Alistipes sp. TaxID=1872444 RepID=UPI001D84DD19|nr:inorganic phosphate transporter [Alistipes sp.]MBS6099675.1 inorganic phosphate transporter [Alistipes sp.]HJI20042.1 inorganic phosphate transporter [Rikenellaceae bacterium]